MTMGFRVGVCVVAAALAGLPVLAHHSFAAEYDAAKLITLKGTVNHVDWVNPHSWVHVDVTDANGKVTTWRCETAPPNILFRRGWTKNSLKEGEQVTVEGYMAKDGSATMSANSVTTASGKRMLTGSAGDGAPKREDDSK
jgi:hypothetical protein